MKKTLLLIFLTACFFKGKAQITVSGRVQDAQSAEPIIGATIHIADNNAFAISDEDGRYEIRNLRPGTLLFEISYISYKVLIQRIAISKDTVLNFSLSESVTELHEVVVTGVSRSTALRETPIAIKTVDQASLFQNTSSNIIDALTKVPGINSISTGPAISKPVVRGLGYNRIITLNNGIRQEGQQWGDEHGIEIDEFAIDRVEIIKGPGSLIYGSDAIGGVLNFIAPKPPADGQTKTQWISNYQSNNNLIANSFSIAGNKTEFQYSGRLTQKLAANYQNANDGKVANSGFRELDGDAFLGLTKKWGYSYLRINSWNSTLNLPEGTRDSLGRFTYENSEGEEIVATDRDLRGYKIGFPHQTIRHAGAALNNYFILRSGSLKIDLGIQNNQRMEFEESAEPEVPGLHTSLFSFNYNARYNLNPVNGWETSFGIGGMLQNNKNKGEEFLIPDYLLADGGVFAISQKKLAKKWMLSGGLRGDIRNLKTEALFLDSSGRPTQKDDPDSFRKFTAIHKNYYGFSGSLGWSFLMDSQNTLKLNISRGFRAPNIAEVSSNGKHEGTFRYEIGNAHLKSENSLQFDLAYFHHSDHLSIEFSPYLNHISNYIFMEKLKSTDGRDSIPDPQNPAPAFQFQQGNAALYGGEIFTDIHPHPLDWLHIENSFSFVRAVQVNQPDSTRNLPFIPAPRYRGEIRAELKDIQKLLSNTYIKFGVSTWLPQNHFYAAYQTETATPAFTLLHAGIGTTLHLKNKKGFLRFLFNVENLTDKAYQNHLSRLKYAPENIATGKMGIYDVGRNYSLKAVFTL